MILFLILAYIVSFGLGTWAAIKLPIEDKFNRGGVFLGIFVLGPISSAFILFIGLIIGIGTVCETLHNKFYSDED